MTKRRVALAILILLAATCAFRPVANLVFAARLALALRSLASGAAGENLPIVQEKVQRRMGNRNLDALVYRPRGSSPSHALLFVAGISELGCYHPRFMALCRYLADKGFLVIAPDIPEFRQFTISAEPTDQIVFWFQQVPHMEESGQVKRVGLAGISFSATLCLIAAARPEIRDHVNFLLGIGPYDDLQRCFHGWFARGPVTVGEGYYPTRFYAKWIIMDAALGMLPAEQDRHFLHGVLLNLLLQRNVPREDSSLTEEGRRWFRLAVMRENQSDDELSRRIEDHLLPVFFRQLDPTQAAERVRCPVFLVHGAYDDLIPPEESRELQRRITGAPCYVLITPFLTHTHPLDKPFGWTQKIAALAEGMPFFYRFARAVR